MPEYKTGKKKEGGEVRHVKVKFSSNSTAGRFVYLVIMAVPLFFIVNLYEWADNKLWVLMVTVIYFLFSGLYLKLNCFDWDLFIEEKKGGILLKRFSEERSISPQQHWSVEHIPIATQLFGAFKLKTDEHSFLFKYKPVHYLFFKNVKKVTGDLEDELEHLSKKA